MALLQRGLLVMATAGALAIPAYMPDQGVTTVPGSQDRTVLKADGAAYEPSSIEFYLDAETQAWIRPGLNVTIGAVTNFAPGLKPTVQLTILDDLKQGLDITGGTTPGVISLRFVPATWDAANRTYRDLITASGNPSRDNAGTWTDLGGGKYSYTFALALQATGWDATAPATLAVVGSRNMVDTLGKSYYVNQWKDFVPSTGADATGKVWAASSNTMCLNCHDSLTFAGSNWPHGGNYRSLRTCVLCHNPSNMKGKNTAGLDLAEFNSQVFFHQTHTGYNGIVADITYPQPINNCDGCHDKTAAMGATWNMFPGRTACGSCHTTVDFTTHAGGQLDDAKCAACHVPDSGKEWDISIVGAHTQEWMSKQQAGLKATIVSASNVKAGSAPTVVIKVTNAKGAAVDGSKLSTFAPMFAGPTTDYGAGTWPALNRGYIREAAGAKAVFDAAAGTTTYTFTGKIPADLKGSVVFSADIYQTTTLLKADGTVRNSAYRDCATNPIYYQSLDAAVPVVNRRSSVAIASCNKCHDHLGLHGGQRLVTNECVICHNPTENDSSRRPTTANPVESIDLKRLIHRIHTGVELTQEFTVYGFGGSLNNYNEVGYPGDRRNCLTCHTNLAGYSPSTAPTRLSTPTPRDYFTPQGPTTAACLGCHDARAYAAHAYLNTAPFGEACQACHSAGSEWGVDKVHAR